MASTSISELPGFTENLNRLFESYRWLDEESGIVLGYKTETLAARLRGLGYQCSDSYLYQLRAGQKANPAAVLLAGLCAAFGDLDVRYWYDSKARVGILRDLEQRKELLDQDAQS